MTLVPINLGRRSNPHRSNKTAGNARHINCFAEALGEEAKAPTAITAMPGLEAFGASVSDDDGVRCLLPLDDKIVAVIGRQVYHYDRFGAATLLTGGVPTDGDVYARRNGRVPVQVGLVSDGFYGVLDGATVTQIYDPDLPPPLCIAFLDGYGALPNRRSYMLTGFQDFTTIDALDEGTSESDPDDLIFMHELDRELVKFSQGSTEWDQDTGDADFPMTRSAARGFGLLGAGGSVAHVQMPEGATLFFVSPDHCVRMLNGYGSTVVSSAEIEKLICDLDEAGRADELKAAAWAHAGRFFYVLSCDDWSRCYDAKGQGWHDRKSYLSDRWRVGPIVKFDGKTICGDVGSGQLYQMKESARDEAGEPLIMEIICAPIHATPNSGRINAIYIDAASGVGLNSAEPQNLDPEMLVDWSKDGGKTFSPARRIPMGRLGKEARRLPPIRRLGRFGSKGLTLRIRIAADVEKLVLSATADVEQLQLKATG